MQHIAFEGRSLVLSACQFLRRKDFVSEVRMPRTESPDSVLMRGFDVAGHYSRPDVFQLVVNEEPMSAVITKPKR